jgi:F-type H+-transporting ATPase subunit delta
MNGTMRIARRYAESFYATIAGDSCRDAVMDDMRGLEYVFRHSPGFRHIVSTPHLHGRKRMQFIENALRSWAHPTTWHFLLFLQSKRRLDLLPSIGAGVLRCHEAAQGLRRASFDTAFEMDAPLASSVTAAVVGRPAELLIVGTRVRPDLLGGFLVRMDDTLYDYSMAGTLRRLRNHMTTSSLGKD